MLFRSRDDHGVESLAAPLKADERIVVDRVDQFRAEQLTAGIRRCCPGSIYSHQRSGLAAESGSELKKSFSRGISLIAFPLRHLGLSNS